MKKHKPAICAVLASVLTLGACGGETVKRVEYINPRGRFHIVAFEVRGKTIKETFQGVEV